MNRILCVLLVLGISGVSCSSLAQSKLFVSEFVESAFDVKSYQQSDVEQQWLLALEVGATITSGNTDTQTYKAKVTGAYFHPQWRINYFAQMLEKIDNGEQKIAKWKVGTKANRDFSESKSSFATIEYEEDQFANFDALATFSAGYTHRLLNQDNMMWDADIGPGVRWVKLDRDLEQEVLTVLHLGTNFLFPLSKHAEFAQKIVSDIGLTAESATVIRSESALTASVFDNLKMKFTYSLRHDSMPGSDKEKLDTQTSLTLLMIF